MTHSRKKKENFRDYENSDRKEIIKKTYRKMHMYQTTSYGEQMRKKYASPEGYTNEYGLKVRLRLMDVFKELDKIIDESDPDTPLPQIFHAFQAGEALKKYLQADGKTLRPDIIVRDLFSETEWKSLSLSQQRMFSGSLHELYPHMKDWSWLPLIGVLHDIGKILASPMLGQLEQWAVVGDTYALRAPFASSNVFYQAGFFTKNPDVNKPSLANQYYGDYVEHCGFDRVTMTWGHDEYAYQILSRTIHHLPEEALYIIHFHSFYPWHTPRENERGYKELASGLDWQRLPLLKAFQQCDLYSKDEAIPNVARLKSYYQGLIDKFIPGREDTGYSLRPAKLLF